MAFIPILNEPEIGQEKIMLNITIIFGTKTVILAVLIAIGKKVIIENTKHEVGI